MKREAQANTSLSQQLKEGGTVYGSFVSLGSADSTEIMALAGFDFLVIDTEHGPWSVETALDLVRACDARGVPSVVRVPDSADATILKSLDIGPAGLQVPQVGTQESAEGIVRAAHYYPKGHRGLAMPRAANYGAMAVDEYFARTAEELLIVVQCESSEGLEALDAVAGVPEIDVIFLGPFDLSHSLGIPGQVEHPKIQEAERRIVEACEKNGKAAGIFVGSGEAAYRRSEEGFRYITVSMDSLLLAKAAKTELAAAKAK